MIDGDDDALRRSEQLGEKDKRSARALKAEICVSTRT